jgi:hypothetical protein
MKEPEDDSLFWCGVCNKNDDSPHTLIDHPWLLKGHRLIPLPKARVMVAEAVEVERKRWARLLHDFGYPFDWTNTDVIPEQDMLDAIAATWVGADGWETLEDAKLDVYTEVGAPYNG